MGYTSTHREPGMSDRAFFERELPQTLTVHGKILRCATVANVFYAAVRNTEAHPGAPGLVWALVCKVHRSRDYFSCTYKEMDESVGPCYYACPDAILDLLSPAENSYAADWRKMCRARNARMARSRKIRPGTVIRFPHRIAFQGGITDDTFEFIARNTFATISGWGTRVRITGWREMAYSIVPAA